jgi:hypothetical protein
VSLKTNATSGCTIGNGNGAGSTSIIDNDEVRGVCGGVPPDRYEITNSIAINRQQQQQQQK